MLYTNLRKGGVNIAVSYKNRIRSLRKKLKLNQEQMAEQLFIDQTTLSMYECGNRDIPVSILMALSTTYGVSVDYLLYKSDFAVLDDSLSVPRQRSLLTV